MTAPVTLEHYLALSLALFLIGVFGVLTRRNAVGILMSVELMLNAANINLVACNHYLNLYQNIGYVFTVFVITVAAAEAAVGLALILSIYRHIRTVFVEEMDILKW